MIEQELATEPAPPIHLHPNLAEIYRKQVENLTEALNADETRQEAGEIIRGLIDEIRLVPDGDELRTHLKGELAEMLALSTSKKPGSKGTGLKTTLVAGVGFEPTTFRVCVCVRVRPTRACCASVFTATKRMVGREAASQIASASAASFLWRLTNGFT